MAIITLTTDIGDTDFYLGAVKGKILSKCKDINIIDISNNINPFDIFHAAFVIKNAYPNFPGQTIHLINVENPDRESKRVLLIEADNQYFLGYDNGLFSLIFDDIAIKSYEIISENLSGYTFLLKDVMAEIACDIANGASIESLARPINHIFELQTLKPVISDSSIRGNVVYIDRYGNVMTNISQELFEERIQEKRMNLLFKRNELIQIISSNYNEVPEGEKLCLFNAAGYLEIAINKGKADELFGFSLGDTVQIDFEG